MDKEEIKKIRTENKLLKDELDKLREQLIQYQASEGAADGKYKIQ